MLNVDTSSCLPPRLRAESSIRGGRAWMRLCRAEDGAAAAGLAACLHVPPCVSKPDAGMGDWDN